MGTTRPPHPVDPVQPVHPPSAEVLAHARTALAAFLTARLGEELAAAWARDAARPPTGRPGLAAQVAVVDELLGVLRAGGLPPRAELRMLLYGYGRHADYDPRWVELLA